MVERARLEIVYTPKGYRGFESLLLRHGKPRNHRGYGVFSIFRPRLQGADLARGRGTRKDKKGLLWTRFCSQNVVKIPALRGGRDYSFLPDLVACLAPYNQILPFLVTRGPPGARYEHNSPISERKEAAAGRRSFVALFDGDGPDPPRPLLFGGLRGVQLAQRLIGGLELIQVGINVLDHAGGADAQDDL